MRNAGIRQCGYIFCFLKVWKQKGEEYRVTGYGGWSWVSKTRVPRFLPKLPGNTNVNYRKELEGKLTTTIISSIYPRFISTLGSFTFFFSDLVAAKLSKENASACTNPQKSQTETKTSQNTANEESEQATVSASSECTSSEENGKPQSMEKEGDLTADLQNTNEEEKRGEKEMEVDPHPETAASSPEKGKCPK